ncbi:MAG: HD domain-containing protein [Thermoleophilaceae bacterium]|nr:HD domain-containing protein [Thermoleophilaceae bacterium]
MNETAALAASPASFQPLNAQTITGSRNFGRSDQITSLIALTVPDAPEQHRGPGPSGRAVTIRRVATLAGQTTIAELRAGADVEGVFACSRKDRLTARSGAPYLAVELRDRTGAIQARAFRDADFLAGQFERGDLVWAAGRVERFRDELQVDLRAIRRAEPGGVDPSAFLPVAYRDLDELDGFLEHLAGEVYDPDLRALLDCFLHDAGFRADFRRAPCTRSGHHAYLGGLLEHTVAVATMALEACSLHPRVNPNVLLAAAILHDAGKTREFELGAEISLSEAGALVGHVAIGQQLVSERARALDGFPGEKLHAVSHCVLGHHGPDALPGKRFRSVEALALYRLNALDAAVKGALEHGLG